MKRQVSQRKKLDCVPHCNRAVKSRTEQLNARKETLRWALVYVDLGWPIIPVWSVDENGKCLCRRKRCHSVGKHAHGRLAPRGIKDAAKDRDRVKLWFAANDLNIGILTGPESGLVVLDVDRYKGGSESLATLEARYGRLDAIEAITGDAGTHFVMHYPEGRCITTRVNQLGPGLDVREAGDYFVACPSRHASGHRYEWKDDPAVVELPPCPEWLEEAGILLKKAPAGRRT